MNELAYTIISIALAVASFGMILYFGLKTDILRESVPNVQMKNRMFSMGRFQLWVWTLVICPVFVLYWGFSYSHGIAMDSTAVILLGIPAGVAVTSNVIGASQSSDLTEHNHVAAEIAVKSAKTTTQVRTQAIESAAATASDPTAAAAPIAAAAATAPTPVILKMHQTSKSFFIDLISGNNGELSLGRLQQLIFTMVFLVIYISTFFSEEMEKLPEFGAQVFALMGISSGTYLVSKGLEKQNKA